MACRRLNNVNVIKHLLRYPRQNLKVSTVPCDRLVHNYTKSHVKTQYKLEVSAEGSKRLLHTTNKVCQEAVDSSPSTNNEEEYEFQAETRMLLDIVARSLYSEKEVFVRELVSNASDAIEKARYMGLQEGSLDVGGDGSMNIELTTDKFAKTLTIIDNGIGMTKEELVNNLGTIARSGSKEFLKQLQDSSSGDSQNIIGQFGVGFYSAFMVADKVDVFTQSMKPNNIGYHWSSDGAGKYTIEEMTGLEPGTKIVCHLKIEDREYSDENTVKNIIKKYSNFVGCPIELNGEQVNNIKAVWMSDPKEVTPEEHVEFCKFIGKSYDSPRFTLHYHTDAPINLRTVLYFPEGKPDLFGIKQQEGDPSGVSLYCRRVLIKNKAANLLPKWLRFVKGVVDSEDIPLNLSRELLQDSTIISRIRTVIQNRVIRFLADKARKDPVNYEKFFSDYSIFLKEGIITAGEHMEKEEIARLVMFETSKLPNGEKCTLGQYISRMEDDQKDIYYIAAPSRELAEASAYYESFKKRDIEVLFCYENYDEIVLMQLGDYGNKKLVSVEKELRQDKTDATYDTESGGLKESEALTLMDWMKTVLAGRCFGIKVTSRLESHPCVVTVEDMGSARHFVRMQSSQYTDDHRFSLLQPQLEINPKHPIIVKMSMLREANPRLAELLAKQLFSNALVMAGLVEDSRTVLSSLNELLQLALEKH